MMTGASIPTIRPRKSAIRATCASCRARGISIEQSPPSMTVADMVAPANDMIMSRCLLGNHTMQTPREILADLWTLAGGDPSALNTVTLTGEEPQLPSSFRVAAAAQASIAAAGLAAAQIWKLRSGQSQDVAVDMRHAVVECRSERYLRVDGKPPAVRPGTPSPGSTKPAINVSCGCTPISRITATPSARC